MSGTFLVYNASRREARKRTLTNVAVLVASVLAGILSAEFVAFCGALPR